MVSARAWFTERPMISLYNIVRDGVHVYDLQATMLHCMGIDHKRLTFKQQGRDSRLTDVHGNVIKPLLA